MAESFNPGLFRTIWYTPLQDALRWHWSAQLDWRKPIALAELPVEIKSLIRSIVQPAWLLRDEKADIAAELVAHFTDGLSAGQSSRDLLQQFGDARRAARLIIRAKRRGRPLVLKAIFHAAAVVFWSIISAGAFYLLLTAFFWLGRPTIRVDDVALVNASIQRQADWRQYNRQLHDFQSAPPQDAGREFLACVLPDMQMKQMFAERYLGSRDGRIVGIALEMFRREHGHFPARLIELVPQFLPAVPADRITGDPVKYKLVAGQPLVYSVGEDRTDDGGVPGTDHGTPILHSSIPYKSRPDEPRAIPGDVISPYAVAEWDVNPRNAKPGDWILFPQWKYWDTTK